MTPTPAAPAPRPRLAARSLAAGSLRGIWGGTGCGA